MRPLHLPTPLSSPSPGPLVPLVVDPGPGTPRSRTPFRRSRQGILRPEASQALPDVGRGGGATTPFLKWVGGKGQLLEQLRPLLPAFANYFEPFLGGGALFFSSCPQRAWLSDLNPRLVECYQVVRDAPEALMALLGEHRAAHCETHYYEIRARYNDAATCTPLARAAMFIYLNKTGYNGLYRENLRGDYNVPCGRYVRPSIFEPDVLRAASRALRGARIAACSYEETLAGAGPGDFVYLDPPYQPVSATARFTSYVRHPFGEAEQRTLAACYRELDARGCKVMLSNSDAGLIRELYRGFAIHEVRATRAINRKGDGRGAVTEIVVLNYDPVSSGQGVSA